MTQQTRSTNKGRFEQGDKPQGSDYVDLVDSYLSLADTDTQTITSDIVVPVLTATTEVSAIQINVSALTVYGHMSAVSVFADEVNASAITGVIVSANTVNASSATFTQVSAATLNADTLNLTGSMVWTAAVTACAISTGISTVPTSVAGYLVMTVSGQTVGVPYFKVA